MTPRVRWRTGTIIALAVAALTFASRWVDVVHVAGTQKGDEATYIAMATSVADDFDLKYTRADYLRYFKTYQHGPEGIFLKRAYDVSLSGKVPVPVTDHLAFGKALIYPVVVAPFVLVGGLGGMLLFNWLLIALCVWCGIRFCQTRMKTGAAAVIGASFVLASDVTVFAAWMTPEVFTFALVFVAYFLWLYKKVAPVERAGRLAGAWTDVVAAILLGAATYAKPNHAILMGPIGLDLLLARRWSSLARAVVLFGVVSGGLYGVNGLVSGELSYQGAGNPGDRRSYYRDFPFDDKGTQFEGVGSGMQTDDAGLGIVTGSSLLGLLPANLFYVWVGRHAGLIPYYFPGVAILFAWMLSMRRAALWQVTTGLVFVASVAAFLILLPDSWNGAGGPPGNRYIVSSYAVLLFLVPAGFSLRTAVVTLLGALAFIGPMVLHPYAASAATWANVERAPLRFLPVEMSMINQLPVMLHGQRGPIMFIKEPTVYFYYLDSNTYYAERDGLWIAGAAATDMIIRTDYPITRLTLTLSSPIDNEVTIDVSSGLPFSGRSAKATVKGGAETVLQLTLTDRDYFRYPTANTQGVYGDSSAYLVHMTTTQGFVPTQFDPKSPDTRNLGVFVKPAFVY